MKSVKVDNIAKMSMQVPFEAADGSQVFEGERKGVPDR